ncbi:MAG: DUF4249 domain-containing protein [Bacteroidaceae bacterium]|nr:DUF4249 domain-containing protein [Bacteroidaceae bacterium]
MRRLSIYIFLSILLASCTEDRFIEAEQQIIVEGWIDAGNYPVVILSKSIPASDEEISLDELGDYVIKWAKVTVSDGEKSVILTGKRSPKHFPPYIYTTTDMRGAEGRSYRLTVEYDDFYATAETSIPKRAEVEKITATRENGKYSLQALIDDNPAENNYYKFFMKVVGRDSMYLSSNLAVIDDKNYTFPSIIPIDLGHSHIYDYNRDYVLSEKDTVLIKFAQIDSVAYAFWDRYKEIIELGRNPIFRFSNSLPSNINGGLGYWFGYGSTEYLCEPYKHESPINLTEKKLEKNQLINP